MLMNEYCPVTKNPEYLLEDHIPDKVAGRESQIAELTECLSPVYKRQKPMNAWLYGESGTGKTLIAKYILKKIEKEAYATGVYVNCWENSSYFSVLDKLVKELRILGADKPETGFKIERIRTCIKDKPIVIILDEIDLIKKPEIESIIYNLSTIRNDGLICIGKSGSIYYSMDNRIKSRLNARLIAFKPYSEKELTKILKQRAECALATKSWSEKILKSIANIAKGDARIAIQILRNAANSADRDSSKSIGLKHIKKVDNLSDDLKKGFLLERLTSHQRILYDLVKGKKEINSGELWKLYQENCRKETIQPIALRTFSDYMNKLIELGLIHWDRALVRGKVRVFSVSD
jgi:cell division control protein 6